MKTVLLFGGVLVVQSTCNIDAYFVKHLLNNNKYLIHNFYLFLAYCIKKKILAS